MGECPLLLVKVEGDSWALGGLGVALVSPPSPWVTWVGSSPTFGT